MKQGLRIWLNSPDYRLFKLGSYHMPILTVGLYKQINVIMTTLIDVMCQWSHVSMGVTMI